jgi:RimJ/RimL family protein N-acetyltransferase
MPGACPASSSKETLMSSILNPFQQPIGAPLPDWSPRARPPHSAAIEGRYCRLEPLDAERHAAALYAAYSQAEDGRDWTYAVIERKTGNAVGTLSLMRIDPANGVVEVGFVAFSPLLKRTPVSTEAQYLLMKHAFDQLGYRRYEWKCDSLNAPSRQAAARLGFQFEGIFRQATVYKGRSRDTAWFSIIDSEWPGLRSAFEKWLAPENFDGQGQQRASLTALRKVESATA